MESRRWRAPAPRPLKRGCKVSATTELQRIAQQLAKNDSLSVKSNLRYVDRIVKGIESDFTKVDGDILVKNDQGRYQLGDFSISFKGQSMLTSREWAEFPRGARHIGVESPGAATGRRIALIEIRPATSASP